MTNSNTIGDKVWAAIAYSPRCIRGVHVTYLGKRQRGRFIRVEGPDGDQHTVARHHVFATREEMLAMHPDLADECRLSFTSR